MNIIEKFADKINGVLETFDRMIINGYILQLCNYRQFLYYLIQNNIKLVDFAKFAEEQTKLLCNHIENYVKASGIEIQYLPSGRIDKRELALQGMAGRTAKTGLISAFSVVEICNTMTVKPNRESKKLELTSRPTRCKHYYLYYNDIEFGWMFLKIQTWFPYNMQIYINGREYLSKILDKHNIKYEMYDNSFSYIEDFDKAQQLANEILNKKLSDSFDGIAGKINNLLPNIKSVFSHSYYWCIDQCEFATDINFKSRDDLSGIYKTLVETSFFTFSSQDIYSFFGRKVDYINNFTKGEIISDLRRRSQGFRIKFKINKNQVKMYDKGNNLRIEVTINNPKDFKILKPEVNKETGEVLETKKWVPMGKSVANLYRYAEISKSIINRYINALPKIDTDRVPLKELIDVSSKKVRGGKSYSAFNILSDDTLKILAALADGAFIINGFNNKTLRQKIFTDGDSKQNISRTTRLLAKLRAHKVIKKVPKSNRYYLTTNGRKIINSILLYTSKTLLNTG
jgi:hypothetical protein